MSGSKKLLLVDDSVNDVELFLMAVDKLEQEVQVQVAYDGLEALEYLQQQLPENLPQLLLIDYKMPRVDGICLLESLQEEPLLKKIPRVVLTSSRSQDDVARAYAAGANAYLLKPVNFTQFNREVETLVKFWLQMNLVDF